jgi:hypothetical protein
VIRYPEGLPEPGEVKILLRNAADQAAVGAAVPAYLCVNWNVFHAHVEVESGFQPVEEDVIDYLQQIWALGGLGIKPCDGEFKTISMGGDKWKWELRKKGMNNQT